MAGSSSSSSSSSMHVCSFLPSYQHEQLLVSSKWLQGSMMLPSFVNPTDNCWLDVHSTTMLLYLMMDFQQLLKSCETNKVSSLSIQFHLAVKEGNNKILLQDALVFVNTPNITTTITEYSVEELAMEDRLPLEKRLFVLRFNPLCESLNAFLNNPACLCRLVGEIRWSSTEKTKMILLSKIFRLGTTRVVVDVLSSCTPQYVDAQHLYDRKPWWYFSSSVPMISQSKGLQDKLLHWTKEVESTYGLQLEDHPPMMSSSSRTGMLFRVRVASFSFDQLFQQEGDEEGECSELAMKEAPILCPLGNKKKDKHLEDSLILRLLSPDSMEPISFPCEVVISPSCTVELDQETKSFVIPATMWHQMVPTAFCKSFPECKKEGDTDFLDLLSTQDNEVSLLLYLRAKEKTTTITTILPYFQVRWTNAATGKVFFSDSSPNRSFKIRFVSLNSDSPSLKGAEAAAAAKTSSCVNDSLQLVKDIREVSLLRKKVQELELQLSVQQQSEKKKKKRNHLVFTQENKENHEHELSSSDLLQLKIDLDQWICSDLQVAKQKQCVSLLTTLCDSIIDDLQQQPWVSVSFSSVPGIVPSILKVTEQQKRLRSSSSSSSFSSVHPVKAVKEVFAAWIQACLQFMKSNSPKDDVEGMKMFLRESFSNNPSNPAYNAALEKCLQVQFARFGDLCLKLRYTIEEIVM